MSELTLPRPRKLKKRQTWRQILELMEVGDSYPLGSASRSTILNTAKALFADNRLYTTRRVPPTDDLHVFRLADPINTPANG